MEIRSGTIKRQCANSASVDNTFFGTRREYIYRGHHFSTGGKIACLYNRNDTLAGLYQLSPIRRKSISLHHVEQVSF